MEFEKIRLGENSWEGLTKISPPLKFGSITLQKKIGSGGFGDVYFGIQSSGIFGITKTDVAVKKLSAGSKIDDEKIRMEISAFKLLQHKNLLTFFGWAKNNFDVYIVLEKADCNLRDYLEETKEFFTKINRYTNEKRFNDGREIALQFLEGLKYLHSKNIAHRDIKHENILIFKKGPIVKIGDYGLLRPLDNAEYTYNMGSIRWAPPEVLFPIQYQPEKSLEKIKLNEQVMKADIYSVGYLLWFIWNVKSPHEELSSMEAIKEKLRVSLLAKSVPIPLSNDIPWGKIIQKCWSYEIAKRPSAQELIQNLNQLSLSPAVTKPKPTVKELIVVNSTQPKETETKPKFRVEDLNKILNELPGSMEGKTEKKREEIVQEREQTEKLKQKKFRPISNYESRNTEIKETEVRRSSSTPDINLILPNSSPSQGILKYHGVYQRKEGDSFYYLRFYEFTAEVIAVSSIETPQQIKKWFIAGSSKVSSGTFKINKKEIKFSTTDSTGIIDYYGKIEHNFLLLESSARINGRKSTNVKFTFVVKYIFVPLE